MATACSYGNKSDYKAYKATVIVGYVPLGKPLCTAQNTDTIRIFFQCLRKITLALGKRIKEKRIAIRGENDEIAHVHGGDMHAICVYRSSIDDIISEFRIRIGKTQILTKKRQTTFTTLFSGKDKAIK